MTEGANTLKEFLVAIGFKVDDASYNVIDKAIVSITLKAIKLGAEIEAAAGIVIAATGKIASAMEQLYFASARTNTSVENIQAFSFAVAQMGGSATAARQTLESLGNFLRSSPAAASLINSLGVSTSANGKPRDETAILADLGTRFAQMPIWRAQAYASRLGIDQNTLFAMINGLGKLTAAYQQMYAAAGLDATGGSQQAHYFMTQLRMLGAAFEILGIKVEASLSGAIGGDIEKFRQLLVSNFGRISEVITWLAKGFMALSDLFMGTILTAFDVLAKLYQTFNHLDPVTKQWIEGIALVIGAWKALNLAFALSPIGMVLALIAGLLLLYQDYETWKSGGRSLIDWSKWQSDIDKAEAFFKWFANTVDHIVGTVGGWQAVFATFLTYFMVTWSASIIGRLGTMLGMLVSFGRGMLALGGGGSAAAAGAAGAGAADAGAGAAGGWLASAGGWLARAAGGAAAGAFLYFDMPGSAPMAGLEQDGQFQPYGKNPVEQQVRDYLMQHYGWSKAAADGIVANLMAESSLDPKAVNGSHYGIGQWDTTRQAHFAKLFGKPIQGSSLGEQLAFYNAELRGSGGDAGAAQAGAAISQPGTGDLEAGADVAYMDERMGTGTAGVLASITRGNMAAALGQQYPAGSAASGGGTVVHQTNTTTITAPSAVTARQLAEHQGRVNQSNARNLNTAINRG